MVDRSWHAGRGHCHQAGASLGLAVAFLEVTWETSVCDGMCDGMVWLSW